MPENSVKIIIEAQSKFEEALKQLKSGISGVTEETKKMEGASKTAASSTSSFLSNLKSNWLGVSAGIAAVYLTIKKGMDFSETAANAKQIRETFDSITRSYQINGDALINKMRQVSGTFVEETGIMTKAQRALVEGFSPDQIIKLTEAARVAARLMGVTVEEAFNRIMEAAITLQTRGIKAAFPMDQELVFRKYAESIGTVADYLTEAGKKQAIYNEIVKQTEDRIRMLGGELLPTAAEKIQAVKSSFSQFLSVLGEEVALKLMWEPALSGATEFAKGIETIIIKIKTLIATAKEVPENIIALLTGGKKVAPGAPTELAVSHERGLPDLAVSHEPGGKSDRSALIDYQKLKKDQFQVDTEYQGKYLALVGERIAAIEKERDKAIADAKSKGMETSEIEKYYAESIEKERTSILGITLQKDIVKGADAVIDSLGAIEQKWREGKATAADYGNAIKATMEKLKGITGEDPTKKLVDLMEESDKKIREIKKAGYDPEKEKQMIQEEIDRWADAKKQIQEAAKPTLDLSLLKSQLNEMLSAYNAIKAQVESQTIKVKVDTSDMDKAKQGVSGLSDSTRNPLDYSMYFYGEGSPKMPISEKIKAIIAEFGSLEGAIGEIESTIRFKEYESQMAGVQKKIDQLNAVWQNWTDLAKFGSADSKLGWHNDERMRSWVESMAQYKEELEILKLRRTEEELRSYEGSFQTGIAYVPKTGRYLLHKGEEVRTTNQVSMAMGGFNFHIYGSDPKAIARQIEKVLKYQISGSLIETIRKIR